MFDEAVKEWLDKNLDEHYPFDHTAENMEYLAQTNGQEVGAELPTSDTFDTAVTSSSAPLDGYGLSPQHDDFFNQILTDATEPAISFNFPSTVEESFELGTQDVSDTQMADRAQNEFLEFTGLPEFTETTDTTETDSPTGPAQIDLSSSILGKRKTPPAEPALEPSKSPKYDDEGEAFALPAAESFDAEQDYRFSSQAAGLTGDAIVPRAMLGDYSLGSVDEVAEVDEGIDFGAEDVEVAAEDELPHEA